jgi:hypothetical protein
MAQPDSIIFVKKIRKDGTPCPKCDDVANQLEKNDQLKFIDRVAIADERDDSSEGMEIARQYNVERAPFFVVSLPDEDQPRIYTVYLKFVKEILNQATSEKDEIADIMDSNPDLDFL